MFNGPLVFSLSIEHLKSSVTSAIPTTRDSLAQESENLLRNGNLEVLLFYVFEELPKVFLMRILCTPFLQLGPEFLEVAPSFLSAGNTTSRPRQSLAAQHMVWVWRSGSRHQIFQRIGRFFDKVCGFTSIRILNGFSEKQISVFILYI